MPVYNASAYLQKAVESIVYQTFTNWELILINDGSTDKSGEICKRFDDRRIRYIEHDENKKLIATLNEGIDLCKGQYIARMDADDVAMPDRLAKQVAFLDKHSDYILVGSNALVIDKNDKVVGQVINPESDELLQVSLLFTSPFVHPSIMIRTDVLQQNKYSTDFIHSEDMELWMRIAKQGKLANLRDKLLKYRLHDVNVSVQYNQQQQANSLQLLHQSLQKLDITPTDEELKLHKLSFELYSHTNQSGQCNNWERTSVNLCNWFLSLTERNKTKKIYNNCVFQAFLWSRWTVYCLFYKKYAKALFPAFVSISPCVLYYYICLLWYLKQKKKA